MGLSLDSSRLELSSVVGQVLRSVWILLDTALAIKSDSRWERPRSNSKIASELLCGPQEKVVPLALRMGQWKICTSLFAGTPLPLLRSCLRSHFP